MAIHCRGKFVPSQRVPFGCIEARRHQNKLRVELVGNGQDDGLEGDQVLGVAHPPSIEWDVHIKPLARTLPYHVIVGILVRREESGIVIPETLQCIT